MTTMPCISIRQPWAWAILNAGKDVENRSWRCPTRLIGQTILIHAGKRFDPDAPELEGLKQLNPQAQKVSLQNFANCHVGGIVGMATIVDCVRDHSSPWAIPGQWHWVLAGARPLPFHICPGRLGIFKAEYPHAVPAGILRGEG